VRGHFASSERPPAATLDVRAAVGAAVVLLVSLIASRAVVEALLPREWPIATYTGVSVLVGYGPSLLWCWAASRRWGTGHFFADVGARLRWSDLGWGPLVWLTALAFEIAIVVIVTATNIPLTSNTEGIGGLDHDRTYILSVLLAGVVAAPLVEEIVFRGVMLRGLRSRLAALPAVAIQGVVFGLAHVDPARGAGNVGLVLVLSGVGIAFGGATEQLRRIGPAMIAHGILNAIALAVVLSQ